MRIKNPEMLQVLLRWGDSKGALKASLILTRNHFSTQALAQGNQGLTLEERGEVEGMLKEEFVSWLVGNE
jgi:hypothetical protein